MRKKSEKEKSPIEAVLLQMTLPYKNNDCTKITISKPNSSVSGSCIKIHIKSKLNDYDKERLHIIAEMSLEDFADAITGLAERPCELTIE